MPPPKRLRSGSLEKGALTRKLAEVDSEVLDHIRSVVRKEMVQNVRKEVEMRIRREVRLVEDARQVQQDIDREAEMARMVRARKAMQEMLVKMRAAYAELGKSLLDLETDLQELRVREAALMEARALAAAQKQTERVDEEIKWYESLLDEDL